MHSCIRDHLIRAFKKHDSTRETVTSLALRYSSAVFRSYAFHEGAFDGRVWNCTWALCI
ncbi:hypothetical protein P692DRAFT_20883623 [Suillus brevipes Sb2]|nr:hypothetical protein P692DRAFT_20883623 [Suillus brevipes Sb2]